jgi:hypothetical protein
MPWFEIEESYTEYVKGRRKVLVFADSLQDAKDEDFTEEDVIEELDADGETTETHYHMETLQYAKQY